MKNILTEAKQMAEVLSTEIPKHLDGKEATLEMKDASGPWKQMEWPGFYFDWKGVRTLSAQIGGGRGPSYGRTEFDYERDFIWDLKATNMDSSTRYIPTNDAESIIDCIADHGLGFVIAKHHSEMDDTGEFKKWHDKKKGKTQMQRDPSYNRTRKQSVTYEEILFIYFRSKADIERGIDDGWILGFQKDFLNQDGSERNKKFKFKKGAIPDDRIIYRDTW